MKNNRGKNGPTGINFADTFTMKPHKRKTFGLGACHKKRKLWATEIYIRELTLAAGALGCAVWDGGVILTRWMYDNHALVVNKTVLELGSGCGLPAILAARFATHVTFTDYVDKILENIQYNIKINCSEPRNPDAEPIDSDDEEKIDLELPFFDRLKNEGTPFRHNIQENTSVYYLDWDEVWRADTGAEPHKKEEPYHGPYRDSNRHMEMKYDVILGAELTYTLLSVESLAYVVDHYLKEDGVMYEVLSDDRDGVSVFVDHMKARGFEAVRCPVDERYTGNFGTRDWEYQDKETYSLWSFYRSGKHIPQKHTLCKEEPN